MSDQSISFAASDAEVTAARRRQSQKVMPLIGSLLGAWDNLPRDIKDDLKVESPGFVQLFAQISAAMEMED